jgi:hypothetical protein
MFVHHTHHLVFWSSPHTWDLQPKPPPHHPPPTELGIDARWMVCNHWNESNLSLATGCNAPSHQLQKMQLHGLAAHDEFHRQHTLSFRDLPGESIQASIGSHQLVLAETHLLKCGHQHHANSCTTIHHDLLHWPPLYIALHKQGFHMLPQFLWFFK